MLHIFLFLFYRTSSAAEYSAYRDHNILKQSLSKDLLGPVVMGPIISLDEWIPERPPKNPLLRVPSPEFLPPPPSPSHATSTQNNPDDDDPLPPPPPELLRHMRQKSEPDSKTNTPSRRNSFAGSSSTRKPFIRVPKFENLSPPLLPRKPNSIELQFNARPFSSMRQPHAATNFQVKQLINSSTGGGAAAAASSPSPQKTIKPNKIVMNGRLEQKTNGSAPNTPTINGNRSSPSNVDNRVSIRKRTHNAPMSLASQDENRNR